MTIPVDDGIQQRTARRQARAIALQALYETDASGHKIGNVIQRLTAEPAVSTEIATLARGLVVGVVARQSDIDNLIADAAPTWPLSQMARVDKNVLRLAIHEAFIDNSAGPLRSTINGAIELAKTFGSDSSSKFVNGVLATIAERHPKM